MIEKLSQEWLRPDDLDVDTAVQREHVVRSKVNKIKKAFDPRRLGVLTVSRRGDGRCYLIDGANRATALRELDRGNDRVPCDVYEGLTLEDEAVKFLALNNDNQPVTPYDVFRVQLTRRDPIALAVEEALHDEGVKLAPGTVKTWPVTKAVKVLLAISEGRGQGRGGKGQLGRATTTRRERVAEVLRFVKVTWPHDNQALTGDMLEAVARVLAQPVNRIEDWSERLRQTTTARALLLTAREQHARQGIGPRFALANLLIDAYNYNRRNRLPYFEGRS